MKIQLDYDKKVVTLDNTVTLKEFVEKIQKILPDWGKWKLETNAVTIEWKTPFIIGPLTYIPKPWYEYDYYTFTNPANGNVFCNSEVAATLCKNVNETKDIKIFSLDSADLKGNYCLEVK